jgi:hypothetical protein
VSGEIRTRRSVSVNNEWTGPKRSRFRTLQYLSEVGGLLGYAAFTLALPWPPEVLGLDGRCHPPPDRSLLPTSCCWHWNALWSPPHDSHWCDYLQLLTVHWPLLKLRQVIGKYRRCWKLVLAPDGRSQGWRST